MGSRIAKAEPLYAQAYDVLKRDVMSGRYSPGERLTDAQLAEELGVSRTPVREAIRQLVREGLLVSEPNRGVSVFRPSARDVAEIYALRASLEGTAAALAALHPDPNSILEQMERLMSASEKAAAAGDTATITENNIAFHDAIIDLSGSTRLRSILEPLRVRSFRMRYDSLSNPKHVQFSLVDHRQLLSQLRQRNPVAAEETMRRHVLQAGHRVVSHLTVDKATGAAAALFRYYDDYVRHFIRPGQE